MRQRADAVYENGVLRLVTPLPNLKDGDRVRVTIAPVTKVDAEEYAGRRAELFERLEAEAKIEQLAPPDEPPPSNWKPLVIQGGPLSETVTSMRRQD